MALILPGCGSAARSGLAIRARAVQRHVVRLYGVRGLAAEPPDRALERLVLERRGGATVVAYEMVVMVAIRTDQLVPRRPAGDGDPLQEPQLGQQAERAVDARNAHALAAAPQSADELVCIHTPAAAAERLDHR